MASPYVVEQPHVEESASALSAPLQGRLTTPEVIRAFVLAGNATLTLRSVATGTRFTYRVRRPSGGEWTKKPATWFVSYLRGPENESDYAYLGMVSHEGRAWKMTQASKCSPDALVAKAWGYFFREVMHDGKLPAALEVWHEGRCGRCGRKLTVPESVERGFGPECGGTICL